MNDSLKTKLKKIMTNTPTTVKADPISLLYGIIIVDLGMWFIDLGNKGLGSFIILVGGIGVLAGCATFVWKSPKIKLLQAADYFLMALLFLGFLTIKARHGILKNPLICLAFAAFMGWNGYNDLKKYRRLSKIQDSSSTKQE